MGATFIHLDERPGRQEQRILRAGWGDAKVRVIAHAGPIPSDVVAASARMLAELDAALDRAEADGAAVVLTGRGAPPELVEVVDLVSEIQPIKHPLQQGIKAQRGIEF